MIIKCYNENHPYLLFIDLEFFNSKTKDNENVNHLVQFAGLLFKWIDTDTYQLMRSCNEYVTDKVCYPFAEYTAITNNFLAENGIPLKDLILSIEEDFVPFSDPVMLNAVASDSLSKEATKISAGKTDVSVTVHVTYSLQ